MTTLLMSKIRAAAIVAFLAVPFGSAVLHAQHQINRTRVNIPFAFEAGSTHFAPGAYFLSDPQEYFLAVRGPSGTALAMTRREQSLSPATRGKLVFYRYGNRYFLREVWVKGQTYHFLCPESKAEQRVIKLQQEATHAAIVTPSNVEIALLQNSR